MDNLEWANNEIEIACARERGDKGAEEWDYGTACYESAFKAFQSLCEDGHSGCSIAFTKAILNRLIDHKPLTPIDDVPDIWYECRDTGSNQYKTYHCKRMPSLFKDIYPDGTVKYRDVDRFICVNVAKPNSGSWRNGFINKLLSDRYPISMPYSPPDKPFIAHCTECLGDPKNGDFDTIGIWYVDKPDGSRDVIEQFFKEDENGPSFVEISREEYEARMKLGTEKEIS